MARFKIIPSELQASRRLFRIVILQFIVLLSFVMAVGILIPLREFLSLEAHFLAYQEDRIDRILLHEGDTLMALGEDWAHWTESWLFIRGENPDYIEDHLDLETVLNLGLNLLSFVRSDGSVVWQMETDLQKEIELVSPQFPSLRFPDWVFSGLQSSLQSAIVLLEERKFLMASVPVMRNDRSGGAPGYLILGRELDERAVAALSELTRVKFSLLNERELKEELSADELRHIREKGGYLRKTWGWLYSYKNMDQISKGSAVLVQEVRISRDIMRLGMNSLSLYLLVSAVGFFLIALLLLSYIRRNYIVPVSSLYWDLKSIREVGDLSFRMSVTGDDEFNQFRQGFNELLEVIEEQTGELTRRNLALSEEANRDALTGMYNKRYFSSQLEAFFRSSRGRRELSLMMIDIDHFKMYNDRYGHIAGDSCIRNVAAALCQVVTRPSDLCARYGGEEFVIVLEDTGRTGGELVAGKIIDQVAALKIENADSPVSPYLTVSIGIAWGRPGSQEDLDSLLLKADKALYASKKKGRNRFTYSPDSN